jgi:hypothetical protein
MQPLRRVATTTMVVLLVLSLCACGDDRTPVSDPPVAAGKAESTGPQPVRQEGLVQLSEPSSPRARVDDFAMPSRNVPTENLDAEDLPGFTTPSGNIGCLFDDYQGAHVRCDRLQMDSVPGGKPADCEFDWGHSVELYAAGPGGLACTSDSVMGLQGQTDGSRVLGYGSAVRYRGIACLSTRNGLLCVNGGGHGFLLARAGIQAG